MNTPLPFFSGYKIIKSYSLLSNVHFQPNSNRILNKVVFMHIKRKPNVLKEKVFLIMFDVFQYNIRNQSMQ